MGFGENEPSWWVELGDALEKLPTTWHVNCYVTGSYLRKKWRFTFSCTFFSSYLPFAFRKEKLHLHEECFHPWVLETLEGHHPPIYCQVSLQIRLVIGMNEHHYAHVLNFSSCYLNFLIVVFSEHLLTRLELWPFSGPFGVQKIIFSFRKIFSQYSVPYRTRSPWHSEH